MATINQALPAPAYPFVDPGTGRINPVWFQFLNTIWQRTGGTTGEGSVQSVSVISGSGIISSVTNATLSPVINLSLEAIEPTSIICGGPISAGGAVSAPNGVFNGGLQFGSFNATTITNNGYITITDSSGTSRKLMVGS